MDRRRSHEVRLYLVSGAILALFAGLFARLALIQVVSRDDYLALAEKQHRVRIRLGVRRGTIRDRVGRDLAASVQAPSVWVNPRLVPDKAWTAARLATLLHVDRLELLRRLKRRPEEARVKGPLSDREVEQLTSAGLLELEGRPLAVRAGALFVRPAAVEDAGELAKKLGPILHRDADEVQADLSGYARFIWVKRKVSDAERRLVRRVAAEERQRVRRALAAARKRLEKRDLTEAESRRATGPRGLAAVGVVTEYRRTYADRGVAPQLVGVVGIDENGLAGLELALDDTLAGTRGRATFRRDRDGHYISCPDLPRREAVAGSDVELTLDVLVQGYAEEALDAAMELWAPISASALVVDPRTGDVLAAATRPTFDPNRAGDYSKADLDGLARARYAVDWMEPGSVMKAFVFSAALAEGVVTEDTVIFCHNGMWQIGSRPLRDHHAYGRLTAAEVIIKSSNIGAAQLGMMLGPRRLYRYLRAFGYAQPTGFDLPGENPGRLSPPREWRPGYTLPSVCIGQEVCVSMLQMTLAYGAIANGGTLMRPRLVRRIVHADGRVDERLPEAVRRVVPEPIARRVRRVLCRVVEEGTGKKAQLESWSVGGKTGTAQKPVPPPGVGYSWKKVICSFVGMAPVREPRVVVMVSVDEPTKRKGGNHYGGTVAAPVVAEILERSLAYLVVPPDREQTLARLHVPERRKGTPR